MQKKRRKNHNPSFSLLCVYNNQFYLFGLIYAMLITCNKGRGKNFPSSHMMHFHYCCSAVHYQTTLLILRYL